MRSFKSLIALCVLFFALTAHGQVIDPIKWEVGISEQRGDTLKLSLNAEIIEDWYTYAYYMDEGGPIPTEISYEFTEGDYTVLDDVAESEVIRKFDETFQMEIGIHEQTATFTQSVIQHKQGAPLNIVVDYQSCNAERCIFENAVLAVPVPGGSSVIENPEATEKDKSFHYKGMFFEGIINGYRD